MILPLLAPLLGSFLAPSLFGALGISGMSPLLMGALGSGLGSLVATGDPRQALLSGAFGYGLGGLGNLAHGASGAARSGIAAGAAKAAAGKTAASLAAKSALMNPAQLALQQKLAQQAAMKAAAATATDATAKAAAGAAAGGLTNPVMGGVQALMQNPMNAARIAATNPLTVGLPLAGGLFLRGPQYAQTRATGNKDQGPKDRPPGGYQPKPRKINPYTGDYEHYGEMGPEHTWFSPTQQAAAAADPAAAMPFIPGGGIFDPQAIQGLYAQGGGVVGPGGPTDDLVPAMLSDGEYVFSAKAVNNVGGGDTGRGFEVLDKLHKKARKMRDGGRVVDLEREPPKMPWERYSGMPNIRGDFLSVTHPVENMSASKVYPFPEKLLPLMLDETARSEAHNQSEYRKDFRKTFPTGFSSRDSTTVGIDADKARSVVADRRRRQMAGRSQMREFKSLMGSVRADIRKRVGLPEDE